VTVVLCVDFGSTYTKGAAVDVADGRLVGTASYPTTLNTDVVDGLDACRDALADRVPLDAPVLACSSAGGGLRIAVVGTEELVTTEAGRRVALSSGGRIGYVSYGPVDAEEVMESAPDVILLVGGTDGGDAEVVLGNAKALAAAHRQVPVVMAGNVDTAAEIAARLDESGVPFVTTDNVVPQIGVLRPEPARAAIRAMFLRHVIGGKRLSSRTDFVGLVRGATPDVVLSAVELLAAGAGPERPGVGDVVVVDIGGATTDVHSVVDVDPEDAALSREVVATVPVSRTVEADLGMRWSAVSTAEAAIDAGLADATLLTEAERLRADPTIVPESSADDAIDLALGSAAATLAVRRHAGRQRVVFAPDGRLVERTGKDLREVALLVGSGGVLRHHDALQAHAVLTAATGEHVEGGWLVPRAPRLVIDRAYVLAAAGLLREEYPDAAYALLRDHVLRRRDLVVNPTRYRPR
jgi:uncharacterized protein (TIGR01319 family)